MYIVTSYENSNTKIKKYKELAIPVCIRVLNWKENDVVLQIIAIFTLGKSATSYKQIFNRNAFCNMTSSL